MIEAFSFALIGWSYRQKLMRVEPSLLEYSLACNSNILNFRLQQCWELAICCKSFAEGPWDYVVRFPSKRNKAKAKPFFFYVDYRLIKLILFQNPVSNEHVSIFLHVEVCPEMSCPWIDENPDAGPACQFNCLKYRGWEDKNFQSVVENFAVFLFPK
jgi:hypothetical protein